MGRASRRIVLDQSFEGGGTAGTPSTRETLRYETFTAGSRQSLLVQVSHTGTCPGHIADPESIVLGVTSCSCPARDAKDLGGRRCARAQERGGRRAHVV